MPVASAQTAKYLELAARLETLIRSGEWAEQARAPGVRAIAQRFGVSIVTASRAVQLLHERGLIETIDRSGSYLKELRGQSVVERWCLYCRVTPGIWRQAGLEMIAGAFHHAAGELHQEILTDHFPIDPVCDSEAWRKSIRQAKRLGARGVCFLPSRLDDANAAKDRQFLACCRTENMPVVLIERAVRDSNNPALEFDLVSADNLESGRLSTRHLLEIGRKRIVLVLASPTSSHRDRAAGFLHELKQHDGANAEILELPIELPGREAYDWIADRLKAFKADAVICYHDYTAVGTMMELLRRGVRVPKDVAVMGFDNYPIGNMFSLGLTTISYPMQLIARHALRLLGERAGGWNGPPIKILVPCTLIVRESTVETMVSAQSGKTQAKTLSGKTAK